MQQKIQNWGKREEKGGKRLAKVYSELADVIQRTEGAAKRLRRMFAFYRRLERYMARTFPNGVCAS